MQGFDAASFGALNADEYDTLHDPGTTEASVALLAELFDGGREVLELAIGTGRIALPLAARGFALTGFDGSPEMLDLLRAKPGGAEIETSVADMADFDLGRRFDHAFLVFNTLFNLPTQEAQIGCFAAVARHLRPGGRFVVETFVPDLSGFSGHQRIKVNRLDMDRVWIEAATHDPVAQRIDMQRVRIEAGGLRLVPLPMRYAWPAEIDLMARLAGLRRIERWGGWAREPFDADAGMHVSVYRKD